MSPRASGTVVPTAAGRDLILERKLPLSSSGAWAWVTESEKTEKWFGTWTGESGVGNRIDVTMNAEAEPHTSEWKILSCDPGSSYEIRSVGGIEWHLGLKVEGIESGSRLTFVQHLDAETEVGSIGAGWEYYLDRLLAAIDNGPMPDFDEYWPAMGPHYDEAGEPGSSS